MLENKEIAIIVAGYKKDTDIEYSLYEIKELASSKSIEVKNTFYQIVPPINIRTFIGEGKTLEIKEYIDENDINLVIFDNTLSGSQIRNLEDVFEVKVIDRNMLILDIFASRAISQEGKLQVELAQLKYTLPRLSGISGSSGRFGASGTGSRGPGESKLELDKRKVQDKIVSLEKKIFVVQKNRQTQNKQRYQSTKSVALIGYTNAGKSTLINSITGSDSYADNRLFATLDVLTKKIWDDGVSYVISDTVGFVSNLPHELTYAFSATLEESTNADILAIVFDIADPKFKEKLAIVQNVLDDIKVDKSKILYVANKIDNATEDLLYDIRIMLENNVVFISAKNKTNLTELKEMFKLKLRK